VAQGGAGLGYKFRAAAFDEIACLCKNFLENIHKVAESGLTVNEFGCRLNEIGIRLELPRRAQRAGGWWVFDNARCHRLMLSFPSPKCKG
jgi:hypothetical protein